MKVRRIIAAAVSAAAVLALNVGMADSAAAKGTGWSVDGRDTKVQTTGTAWS
jgi:hypothetical protein